MTPKQEWMKKGARVDAGAYKGRIRTITECRTGRGAGVVNVLTMYVQPNGVLHAWPVNPASLTPVIPAKR